MNLSKDNLLLAVIIITLFGSGVLALFSTLSWYYGFYRLPPENIEKMISHPITGWIISSIGFLGSAFGLKSSKIFQKTLTDWASEIDNRIRKIESNSKSDVYYSYCYEKKMKSDKK